MRKALILLLISTTIAITGCSSNEDKPVTNQGITDTNQSVKEDVDLTDSSKEIASEINAKIFYIDNNGNIISKNSKIMYTGNDLMTPLNKELQSSISYFPKTFEIEKAVKNEDKSSVTISIKNDIFKENKFSQIERKGLIDSLINTYGFTFNVENVTIKINDNFYIGLNENMENGSYNIKYEDKIDFNERAVKEMKIYLYDGVEDKLFYTPQNIEIFDKAVINALAKKISFISKGNFFDFEEDLKIISANIDKEKDLLTVNLDKSYYNILRRVGSGSELGALKSIAYTFGENCGVKNVEILVDSKTYESGHIILQEGEYFKINTTDIKEFK